MGTPWPTGRPISLNTSLIGHNAWWSTNSREKCFSSHLNCS